MKEAADGRQPLPAALVTATDAASGERHAVRSDSNGRFTLLFNRHGGRYTVVARLVGYSADSASAIPEIPVRMLVLRPLMAQLAAVRVAGERPPVVTTRETERDLTGGDRVMGDVTTPSSSSPDGYVSGLANSFASAVVVPDPSGGPPGFSVAGARPNQNRVTLNGSTFTGTSLPEYFYSRPMLAAVSYDVTQGQFSGASLDLATGLTAPTARYVTLTSTGPVGSSYAGSGGLGSAPYAERLSTVFAHPGRKDGTQSRLAFDVSVEGGIPTSLLRQAGSSSATLGLSPDSVAVFRSALRSRDIPLGVQPRGGVTVTSTAGAWVFGVGAPSLIAPPAFGVLVTENTTYRSAVGANSTALSSTTATQDVANVATQFSWHWTTAGGIANTMTTAFSVNHTAVDPLVQLPSGVVDIGSALVRFGGSGIGRRSTRLGLWETQQQSRWMSWNGKHERVEYSFFRADDYEASALSGLGTFVYRSAADIAANEPAAFARTLASSQALHGRTYTAGLALGDVSRPAAGLRVNLGFRAEGTVSGALPGASPAVISLAGPTTSRVQDGGVSPRFGFVWVPGHVRAGERFGTVSGGIGNFRGTLPLTTLADAGASTWGGSAPRAISCVGSAVPTPAWPDYAANPATVPAMCASEQGDIGEFGPARDATVWSRGTHVPHAWRSNLIWTGNTAWPFTPRVEALYSRNSDIPNTTDANLVSTPRFTLPTEGGRAVFVPANAVVPATGAIALGASRVDPALGYVDVFGNPLVSVSRQLSAGVVGDHSYAAWRLSGSLHYTHRVTREQALGVTRRAIRGELDGHRARMTGAIN